MHVGTQIGRLLPLFTRNEFSISQIKMSSFYYLLVVLTQHEFVLSLCTLGKKAAMYASKR